MPIEIRELTIKTEIHSSTRPGSDASREKELNTMKQLLLEECKRMIAGAARKSVIKR